MRTTERVQFALVVCDFGIKEKGAEGGWLYHVHHQSIIKTIERCPGRPDLNVGLFC